MKTIYKYTLIVADMQILLLPVGFKILCAKVQNGNVCLWVLVPALPAGDPIPGTSVFIHIRGTGHTISEEHSANYIDTVMLNNGELVFHLFYTEPS